MLLAAICGATLASTQITNEAGKLIIDGTTNWGTGGPKPSAPGFDLEARSNSIYEWVRQVRGGVLAGAFTVERHLSATIVHFMLGKRVDVPEVAKAFDEGLLMQLTFDRRISVVMLIAPHFLKSDEAASFKSDLSELRTLRNAMAHNPFWFQPQLNDKGEVFELVPLIKRGKGPLPLTSPLIEQLNLKIASLIDRSAKLATKVMKREEEASKSPLPLSLTGKPRGDG